MDVSCVGSPIAGWPYCSDCAYKPWGCMPVAKAARTRAGKKKKEIVRWWVGEPTGLFFVEPRVTIRRAMALAGMVVEAEEAIQGLPTAEIDHGGVTWCWKELVRSCAVRLGGGRITMRSQQPGEGSCGKWEGREKLTMTLGSQLKRPPCAKTELELGPWVGTSRLG